MRGAVLLGYDVGVALALALVIDASIGDPPALWRRLGHPVVWIGRCIAWGDADFNQSETAPTRRRQNGAAMVAALVLGAFAIGVALAALAAFLPASQITMGAMASVFLAQRGLADHVGAVAEALETHGVETGRRAVAHIVGRKTHALDEAGVARAAIESAAENFSDGLVAPVFWFAFLGLPGLIAYKAVNTADSMIGHRTPRHADFGCAAARLDDVLNLPASRLAAVTLCLAAPALRGRSSINAIKRGFKSVRRDARRHRSPNAGWPEAAMAGVLDVALSGPRVYSQTPSADPYINPQGRRAIGAPDIRRSVRLLWGGWVLIVLVAVALAAF